MDYEQKFLYRDIRENLSTILIDGINANPNFKPIKKSNRIDKKDVQFGNLTNKITGISKASDALYSSWKTSSLPTLLSWQITSA